MKVREPGGGARPSTAEQRAGQVRGGGGSERKVVVPVPWFRCGGTGRCGVVRGRLSSTLGGTPQTPLVGHRFRGSDVAAGFDMASLEVAYRRLWGEPPRPPSHATDPVVPLRRARASGVVRFVGQRPRTSNATAGRSRAAFASWAPGDPGAKYAAADTAAVLGPHPGPPPEGAGVVSPIGCLVGEGGPRSRSALGASAGDPSG